MYLCAAVQLRSTDDIVSNFERAEGWIRRAALAGARLVTTPENTTFLGPAASKLRVAEPVDGPLHRRYAALAAELGIFLVVGSVAERAEVADRCYNTSLLFGPEGALWGSYRKLHLFDIDLPDGPRFVESATILPGDEAVVVDTPLGRIGLSICYDLRFPELYRALVARGAEIVTVPSAFTQKTGRDHWHVLLRARAIETQCFVIAPAQEGRHDPAGLRDSYGHSLIIDPWGTVLAECGEGEGVALALVDRARLADVRRAMPVMDHRRFGSPNLFRSGTSGPPASRDRL